MRLTVRFRQVYEERGKLFLVTQLCRGGELYGRIAQDRLTEEQAALAMASVVAAVAYCHRNCITHGDIKPENFVFTTRVKQPPLLS